MLGDERYRLGDNYGERVRVEEGVDDKHDTQKDDSAREGRGKRAITFYVLRFTLVARGCLLFSFDGEQFS